MAMLVVIWVVLKRFMGGFGIEQMNDGGIRLMGRVVGKGFPEKERWAYNI